MEDSLASALTVPDLWQQKAVRLLRAGHDVVVHAPTGAGKTFVFELLMAGGFSGKAVYTVPTRALANDKLHEWRSKGWNVGIETGDVSHNTDAPVIVATLEAQKRRLISGRGPQLLVIDEYQMIGDPSRGVNYELAIALSPPETQLLLLSGSVANTGDIVGWLRRADRNAVCVSHEERPVPLDEVHLDALPDLKRKDIHGRWPRYVARALAAGLGPILIFAPRRKAAETLALNLAAALPEENPIVLTPEQKAVAGNELTRCLKNRVAFHHSGMRYNQRAGLVEPLAKHSQLKVIVATTGLAAGINFSMRSVLVMEREYRVADAHRLLRPDELLQMFGRAGRRGLDERGTVLYLEGLPRLQDARPLQLKRGSTVDWPSLITVLDAAAQAGEPPLKATRRVVGRLFARERIRLGLEDFLLQRKAQPPQTGAPHSTEQPLSGGTVVEFANSAGVWERKRAPVLFKLKDTLYRSGENWLPGLSHPGLLSSIRIGTLWKSGKGRERRYGLDAPIATFPDDTKDDRLTLSKWLLKALREQERHEGRKPNIPKRWTLEAIEKRIVPKLPLLSRGGRCMQLNPHKGQLIARLDYAEAEIYAYRDLEGKGLLNPKLRKRQIAGSFDSPSEPARAAAGTCHSAAEYWYALGLIDERASPTRRGILFSFFNHGEGLAVAAALEEPSYAVEELIYDLANLRAGHRFAALALAGRPLAAVCQERYGLRTIPGYLRRGLPEDYGDGASEILYNVENRSSRAETYLDEELSLGDIERARVEWLSLLAHIATAPDYDWGRWRELQQACRQKIALRKPGLPFDELPPLTHQQRSPNTSS
ncbi:DEAD/DEAH box helicase [Coraliomargarita parva]|uniref:DEAD/DEAH box helicase n=1 Tax=Coraliomargarita parva TaxID=3014050 RepID=UPI0022B519A2|nr:DEAD/DEAH box helicase [Coraliomargarita parva]